MYGITLATLYLLVGGLVFLLGIVILREAPHERANRATALMLFFAGIGSVLGAMGFLLESVSPTPRAGSNDLLRSFNYLWELFFPSLLYFACVFPRENAFVRRVPWIAAWIFVPHVFHLMFMVLLSQGAMWGKVAAWMAQAPAGTALLRLGHIPLQLAIQFHRILFSVVNLVYIAAGLTLLWISYRRTLNPRIRVQVRTIFLGLASCAGLYATAIPIPTLLNLSWPPVQRSTLVVAALILGSGAIAYSMVRYRFLDAKLIARKSILYAVTSAFLIGVYVTVIRQLDAFLEISAGMDPTVIQTSVLLLSLVLFQPIFSWLEEALERLFLRERGDHRTLLRRVSSEVLTVLDLGTLIETLLSALREAVPARTTVLLVAPGAQSPIARGFGGDVDLDAIAAIPRDALDRLLAATSIALREEIPALAEERGVRQEVEPLLATLPYVVLPLRHAGQFLGLIALGRKITETRYNAEETALLQTLANQTSVAVKNALLYRDSLAKSALEEELAVARRIQQQFLPRELPRASRFEIAAMNVPNKQVGGDYYDLVDVGEGNYLLAIADVAGKGVPAALLASMVQASIRTQARDGKTVGEMMNRLNRLVHEATPDDRFATCFLARVGSEGMHLSFSNAGHNYPILLSNGGCRLLSEGGIPLGIAPEVYYPEASAILSTGDSLVLYTDGIPDSRNRDLVDYGEERLVDVVRALPADLSAQQMLREIAADVARFTEGADQMDDMTLLALKVV